MPTTKDAPLAIEVPAAAQDKPAWVKVGVIAAVGFIVGIAWPRVVGVRLGPSAPGEAAAAAASASAAAAAQQHGGRAPEAPPPASVTTKATTPAASAASSAAAAATAAAVPPTITVMKGTVLSCKTSDGETKKGKECGAVPGIDQLVFPRVKKISTCSGVEGQTGKLSLVVNADFDSKRFWYDVGKTSTLPNIDAVASCLKTSFHGTSAIGTPHEHSRYTVAYVATFAPGTPAKEADDSEKPSGVAAHKDKDKDKKAKDGDDKPGPESEPTTPPSSPSAAVGNGEAQVAWEVALVRDAPKTGGLVSRLPRGTKVKVGATRDGWYQVKFGEAFDKEGWVYRGAIGR